jgi:hypothetical protein
VRSGKPRCLRSARLLHHGLLCPIAEMRRAVLFGPWFCALLVIRPAAASEDELETPPPRAANSPVLVELRVRRELGAESCVSAPELTSAVETRLGRRVFTATSDADLKASVRALRAGRRFVLELSLENPRGQRIGVRRLETQARNCSALDDSVALVLALAVDLRRNDPRLVPVPAREPTPEPSLATPLAIPADTPLKRATLELQPRLGGVVAVGLLPRAALGLDLSLGVSFARFWPVELGVTLWRSERLGRSQGVDFSLQSYRLAVCPFEAPLGRVGVRFCVEQDMRRSDARGFGFDRDQPGGGWVPALGGRVGATVDVGSLFLGATGSLLVPFVQRRYFYDDGGEVTLYRTPWWSGALGLALGVRW